MEFAPINRVWVFTLYGEKAAKFDTPEEAVKYIQDSPDESMGHLVRIEVQIRLTTGEVIEGTFTTKDRAIIFITERRF